MKLRGVSIQKQSYRAPVSGNAGHTVTAELYNNIIMYGYRVTWYYEYTVFRNGTVNNVIRQHEPATSGLYYIIIIMNSK